MKFNNLKMFPEKRIKSLFGLKPDILCEVCLSGVLIIRLVSLCLM